MRVSRPQRSDIVEQALLALGNRPILTVPSLDGARQGHWLSYWDDLPNVHRIDLPFWSYPRRDAWVDVLREAVEAAPQGLMLVGHGLGCVAISLWTALCRPAGRLAKIAGALFVSPLDTEDERADPRCAEFRPMPKHVMPFPSLLVGNAQSRSVAERWGSRIDADAAPDRPGPWPEGLMLLASLAGGPRAAAPLPA